MSEFANEQGEAANEDVAAPISTEHGVGDPETAGPPEDTEDNWDD